MIDADGHAWYTDFGNQVIGELDPKTGKVSDYKLELLRPDQPKGSLDLEFDPDGNIWVGMSYQGGASKIDRKTKQVTTYALNKEWLDLTTQTNMVTPTHMYVDNKVWMTDNGDPQPLPARYHDRQMGEPRGLQARRTADLTATAMPTDKDNNVYMLEFGGNSIGMRNAKTQRGQDLVDGGYAHAAAARPLRRSGPALVRANMAATPSACSIPRPSR